MLDPRADVGSCCFGPKCFSRDHSKHVSAYVVVGNLQTPSIADQTLSFGSHEMLNYIQIPCICNSKPLRLSRVTVLCLEQVTCRLAVDRQTIRDAPTAGGLQLLNSLVDDNRRLHGQVLEMEAFLKDHGLVWVGSGMYTSERPFLPCI